MAEEFETHPQQSRTHLGGLSWGEIGRLLDREGLSFVILFDASASLMREAPLFDPSSLPGQKGLPLELGRGAYYTEEFLKHRIDWTADPGHIRSGARLYFSMPHASLRGEASDSEEHALSSGKGSRVSGGRSSEQEDSPRPDSDTELEQIRRLLRESSELGAEIRTGIDSLKQRGPLRDGQV